MNVLEKIFTTNQLTEVFTPNTVAKLTYVKRQTIDSDLEKYLQIPGNQIIIYGHSGGGKTTLLRNKLSEIGQNYIKTHCESTTTFNDLLMQAFDELNIFYIQERSTNSQYSISTELKAEYLGISSKVTSNYTEMQGEKSIRIIPPQLTPQKLAQFLGEINCLWIIEDFHKVAEHEKKRIADVIKIFIDAANDYKKVKIVCIGAVGTARELIELDNNLNNRIVELFVPLLTDDEIDSIVVKGFDLLNVSITDDLKGKIVYYSNNLASITHQICYDLCFHSRIQKSKFLSKRLRNNTFKDAVNSYVRKNSDTFTKIYDTIICQRYGWHVLKTFEHLEKEHLSFDEIKTKIPNQKRPSDEELLNYLEQLGSPEYKEIVRYDRSSMKYSISSPFFKAFLKMKLALEKAEKNETMARKKKKMNNKYSIADSTYTLVTSNVIFDEAFFIQYNDILETMLNEETKVHRTLRISKM
ncbi:MAG: ATP-binding protein [Bacteroidia bacterium]|nr:ATP-binding protein [Bacteroidia bacterium]